jgi:rubrerythrin
MNFNDFESVIKFALEREKEAIRFYGQLLEKANFPGIKELLQELQAEEGKHKELLEELLQKTLPPTDIPEVEDMKISDYVIDKSLDEDMSFQDILIFAAKKEQKTIDLYRELAQRVSSPELKKLFDFLVSQEKTHKLRLESEYEKHVLEDN